MKQATKKKLTRIFLTIQPLNILRIVNISVKIYDLRNFASVEMLTPRILRVNLSEKNSSLLMTYQKRKEKKN